MHRRESVIGPTRKCRPSARLVRLLRETGRADEVCGMARFDPLRKSLL
jgi:hypothetical protein